MGIFSRPKRFPDPTDGRADFAGHDSNTPLLLADSRLPARVSSLGASFGPDLAAVHRMDTDQGIEWWFISHDGGLLEALSFE